MSDERPFERLAAHAGPADIDPGFQNRLYDVLQQEMGRTNRASRPILLLVAALLTILAISAAVAIGSGVVELPAILPGPLPAPSDQAPAAPSPSVVPEPQLGVVAYEELDRIWVVNADGTDAREFAAEVPGGKHFLGWLPDGSALVYRTVDGGRQGIGLTDLDGSQRVAYGDLCPVGLDSCYPELESVGISPDGTSVAYAVSWPNPTVSVNDFHSAIAILELATGRVTQVVSTETSFPAGVCDAPAGQGQNRSATWSADGTRLVFIRDFYYPLDGTCSGVFTVNADGSDLQEVVLPDALQGQLPMWSPDGSAFFINAEGDIYTGRADFTDIRAMTSDGLSSGWAWTRDGRIILIRWTGTGSNRQGDLWVMDADGGSPTQLEATLPALTAARCVVCPYPFDPLADHPFRDFWITPMFWQPMPGDQP